MFGSFTGPFSCLLVTEAENGKWETSLRSLCSSVLVRSWWNGWCWYNIVAGKVTCQWLYCLCPLVQIHLYWMAKVSFLSIFLHYPIVMLVDTHLMAVFQDSWVSRFQIVSFLDCIGAKDDGGGGDNWSYETYYPTLSFSLILCLSVCLSLPLSLPLPVHFNGHFPGEPGLAGIRMSPFQILLELRVLKVVVATVAIKHAKLQSKCYHQQTNTQFFTGWMPFLSPNQQHQSTEGKRCTVLLADIIAYVAMVKLLAYGDESLDVHSQGASGHGKSWNLGRPFSRPGKS